MHILYNLLFLLAAFKWGDWRNWGKYYPTWLFFIGGDLFYNAVLHEHRLWYYTETIWASNLLYGHKIINILTMLIVYSSTLLIYLGNYPKQKYKQVLWILTWVSIYSLIEVIFSKLHLIKHDHSWTIYWSILFNIVMFSVLKIHFKKPLLAWIIAVLYFTFLYYYFDLPKELFE